MTSRMPSKSQRVLSSLSALSVLLVVGMALARDGDLVAGGTGDDLPPIGAPTPGAFKPAWAPTSQQVGPLPSFVMSTVSTRFVLVLRRLNGAVVDTARVGVRTFADLEGPVDETLRLDVLPLDGEGLPVIGVPVVVGQSVGVLVDAD